MRVLIIGGYGMFGGRLVDLLADEPRLALIVAGRSLSKAEAFCAARATAKARLIPRAFDRTGLVAAQLAELSVDLVVDASGPFQAYGDGRYAIIQACIAAGVCYLDLADGADFVLGVGALDRQARAAGVFVLSGVSSFPALTAAVVRHLAAPMARIDKITGGVSPSPFARVGENVIRSIASYAGKPVVMRRDGHDGIGYPLSEQQRATIMPPGGIPLPGRLFSLVEVPDLQALADLWPDVKSVWIGAGPVPEAPHRVLIACAWLVRLGLVRSLTPLVPVMHFFTTILRWGEHRGGVFVAVEGADASGAILRRSWHLVAEGDDGPMIPSMAAEAIIRARLDGRVPSSGARPGYRELDLADFEARFRARAIRSGTREDQPARPEPLYKRILGSAWDRLPAEIRALHNFENEAVVEGRASVKRGHGLLARNAAAMVGFPKAVDDTPVAVRFDRRDGVETWTRTFGLETFSSRQFAGRGREDGLICESFGPLIFAMALVLDDGRLSLVLRGWRFLGLPLPAWLCPRSQAHESVEDGRFRFHVRISHPLTGLIVEYRGWLSKAGPETSAGGG
jgi:hypothetical protein